VSDEHGATRDERRAVAGVFAGSALIAIAFASAWLPRGAPTWGVCAMVLGCGAIIASASLLGALRSGVRRTIAISAAAFLFVIIGAGFGVPIFLPAEAAESPLLLGLPLRTAIEVYGVGLLPVFVLPVLFAVEFKRRRS
jgi:hypothetical protein